MMMMHSPIKIEKRPGCGKAKRVTRCTLLPLSTFLLLLAVVAAPAVAGGDAHGRAPRSVAMGGASAALAGMEALWGNPAMLAGTAVGGSVCWTPARFGMGELAEAAAGGVMPAGEWTFAASLVRFGYEAYAEHRAGIGIAMEAGTSFSLGMRLQALHIGIRGYGDALVPMVDVGAGLRLGEELRLGVVARTVNMPTVADDERLPVELAIGIAWTHEQLLLLCDMAKEARVDADLRFGVEYQLLGVLALRAGYSTLSREWSSGLGLRHSSFVVGYAFALHSELGATHTVGLGFTP